MTYTGPSGDLVPGRLFPPKPGNTNNPMGSDTCPWVIRALQGQRISVTLLLFTEAKKNYINKTCGNNIVIADGDNRSTIRVCDVDKREKLLFSSTGHHVTIYATVNDTLPDQEEFRYVLKYKGRFYYLHYSNKIFGLLLNVLIQR